jgi:hypothetical protein
VADDRERLARGELSRQQPARVGVEGQVLHRAVAAGQVNSVVVLEADVGQLERPPHLLGRADDVFQVDGFLLPARHGRAEGHRHACRSR